MKYFKLGLLAVTVSLVALVIALDKKYNKECGSDCCDDKGESSEKDFSEGIVVEESVL